MKLILLLSLIPVLIPISFSQSQTPVYLTFTTHNEDAEPYQNFNYYLPRRNFIVRLADSVSKKGAIWDFQSDWKFLQAVKNFDTGSVLQNTNGKNLLKWLKEDMGIEIDPHSHEANGYNYADVAYLHTLLGVVPNKIVGGFLYNVIIGGNNWENLENGIYGRMYPAYFWKPDILWGGGTQNHINDPQNSGAWKPQNMTNFYIHDSTKHLVLLGNYCNNKIYDTTIVTTVVRRIRNIVDAITYGAVPDSGFYTATVHTQIGDLNTAQILKVCQFIDSMNTFVSQGKIIWKSLNDIYYEWNTSYGKKPFWVNCSQIPLQYGFYGIKIIPEGYFDTPNTFLNMRDTVTAFLRSLTSPYSIVDSAKSILDTLSYMGSFAFFRAANGNYYIQIKHRNCIDTWSKPGGELFISGSTMAYDFTASSSQAYGNNLKLKNGKYCIYSGDCDRDDAIDVSDLSMIYNDAISISTGFLQTDLNGDYAADVSDLLIAYNNSIDMITEISP